MSTRLSKSRFQKGLQCERALWLAVHEPQSADPITESKQWTFDQGARVGRIAHQLFPGGTEVTEDHLHSAEALETTRELLADGMGILYEPAFFFDGVLVRVDILVAIETEDSTDGDRLFDLYEVKSSSKLKPEHITDTAVQTYVVEGAGVRIRRSHVVHVDTSYVYAGGPFDPAGLFRVEDVTDQVRAFMPLVHDQLGQFRRMLDGPEPHVRIGQRCRTPYECDFVTRCHGFLPSEHPVTRLPRISDEALHALLEQGILCIRDVPEIFEPLTPAQRLTVRVAKEGLPSVDESGLASDLARLEYPIRHLDFETFRAALPLWPGTRPYELIPFQYSIHTEHQDGRTEHLEYLHTGSGDPRPSLVRRLLNDLGDTGSITHYTGYERSVLDALAASVPGSAESLTRLRPRLFDLEAVIRTRTRHPATDGRTSIKCVLPAWCDEVSYDDLGIQDGQVASIRYLEAITGQLSESERQSAFDDLLEYCGTDTLAMVRLLATLRDLASS